MRSRTKLDFLFYDFSVIYYDFSKIIWKQIEKKKKSKPQYCSKTAIKNRRGGGFERFWIVQEVY